MECQQCRGWLSEYLDGELSGADYEEMKSHLELCPDCRQVMDELAAITQEIILSIESIPIPTNLTFKILSVIKKEKEKAAKQLWLTGILLAVFASPLLIVFSRIISSVFYLVYATGTVFWRSLIAFVMDVSPWATVAIGISSLLVMIMGASIIKALLSKFEMDEVFQ